MSTTFEDTFVEEESSLSQSELIDEFHRLDQEIKTAAIRRKEVGMALAGIAYANKGTQNTVHLEGVGGRKIKVEFGTETEYDPAQLRDVSNLVGSDKFDSLFKTKLEFVAKKRELTKFMNTVSGQEAIETAKQIIKDATYTKDKQPYVSCE